MENKNYDLTIKAAFGGYIVQAVVNNFLPLLFVQMQNEFNIPLAQITMLITINFFWDRCCLHYVWEHQEQYMVFAVINWI